MFTSIKNTIIAECSVSDIRFPFPALGPGSDANNAHTTYSNPYVVITDSDGHKGVGIGFTLGLGNDHVCRAIDDLFPLIEGCRLADVISDFREIGRAHV